MRYRRRVVTKPVLVHIINGLFRGLNLDSLVKLSLRGHRLVFLTPGENNLGLGLVDKDFGQSLLGDLVVLQVDKVCSTDLNLLHILVSLKDRLQLPEG